MIEQYMWIIWLVLFVLALVIEAIGTDLVSIWFAFGAIIALIASLVPDVSWWIELIIFLVVSLGSLAALRPLIHRYLRKNTTTSNVDSIVGQKGLLISRIDLLHRGEVKINDVIWTAIASKETETIEKGSVVKVLAVSGNKLIVTKSEDKINLSKEEN